MPGTIWDRFPYLLPNIICTLVVLFSLTVGILFLEETHASKKHRSDAGVRAGQWLVRKFQRQSDLQYSPLEQSEAAYGYAEATLPAEDFEVPVPQPLVKMLDEMTSEKPQRSTIRAFNGQVLLSIVAYGILAL